MIKRYSLNISFDIDLEKWKDSPWNGYVDSPVEALKRVLDHEIGKGMMLRNDSLWRAISNVEYELE